MRDKDNPIDKPRARGSSDDWVEAWLREGEEKFRQPDLDLSVGVICYLAAEKNVCV